MRETATKYRSLGGGVVNLTGAAVGEVTYIDPPPLLSHTHLLVNMRRRVEEEEEERGRRAYGASIVQ